MCGRFYVDKETILAIERLVAGMDHGIRFRRRRIFIRPRLRR